MIFRNGLKHMRTTDFSTVLMAALFTLMIGTDLSVAQTRQDQPSKSIPNAVAGTATDGLRPVIQFVKSGKTWHVQILFVGQVKFDRNQWLHITNKFGSKLTARDDNGVEINITDHEALAARTLPSVTTVSNVISGISRSRRGMQWWPHSKSPSDVGEIDPAYYFDLNSILGKDCTNDFSVELRPLVYRANENDGNLHLIEFPPIRVRLKPNGVVEKIE
jgi:hypothetical protein